jgi:hypothetical protein
MDNHMLCPETSRIVSLWTKEPAEDSRLKKALDRSAPCPSLLRDASYVEVDDGDEDTDDDMVQPCRF